jgi:hypothetical protein
VDGSTAGVGEATRGSGRTDDVTLVSRAQAAVAQEAPAPLGIDVRVEEICGWHPPLGRHG